MKMSVNSIAGAVCFSLLAVGLTGCATNLRKPNAEPQPTKVRLSQFKSVGLKTVVVDPAFSGAKANEKARKKINAVLVTNMKMVFPGLKLVDADGKDGANGKPALVIEPVIEEIKFIGGFARFMVGAMAGSSAVLMKVTYTDTATGEVLGSSEFYRSANAMGGGMSIGGSDNMMLEQIAQEIVLYTKMNL